MKTLICLVALLLPAIASANERVSLSLQGCPYEQEELERAVALEARAMNRAQGGMESWRVVVVCQKTAVLSRLLRQDDSPVERVLLHEADDVPDTRRLSLAIAELIDTTRAMRALPSERSPAPAPSEESPEATQVVQMPEEAALAVWRVGAGLRSLFDSGGRLLLGARLTTEYMGGNPWGVRVEASGHLDEEFSRLGASSMQLWSGSLLGVWRVQPTSWSEIDLSAGGEFGSMQLDAQPARDRGVGAPGGFGYAGPRLGASAAACAWSSLCLVFAVDAGFALLGGSVFVDEERIWALQGAFGSMSIHAIWRFATATEP